MIVQLEAGWMSKTHDCVSQHSLSLISKQAKSRRARWKSFVGRWWVWSIWRRGQRRWIWDAFDSQACFWGPDVANAQIVHHSLVHNRPRQNSISRLSVSLITRCFTIGRRRIGLKTYLLCNWQGNDASCAHVNLQLQSGIALSAESLTEQNRPMIAEQSISCS